jgi:hypothetical protein
MSESSSTTKQVLIKLVGIDSPCTAYLTSFELGGVWLQDKALALALAKSAGHQELPAFTGSRPAVFVPLFQVQWIMASD